MNSFSEKLSMALEQTNGGQKLLQGALIIRRERSVTLAEIRKQKVLDEHRRIIEIQKARFAELKELVKEVWPNRSDILAQAIARNSSGSSRLWNLAAEPRFENTKTALMFAGTGPEAEKQAKLLLFPR